MANFFSYLGADATPIVAPVEQSIQDMVTGFLQHVPNPSPSDISALLKLVPISKWTQASQALVANGAPVSIVSAGTTQATQHKTAWVKDGLVLLSATASAYHGTKRNDSLIWGAWWGLWALALPVATPIMALVQGFGKSKCARCSNK